MNETGTRSQSPPRVLPGEAEAATEQQDVYAKQEDLFSAGIPEESP